MHWADLFYKLKIGHEIADVDVIGFQCKICMLLTSMTCNPTSVRNFRVLCSVIVKVFILLIIHK
jgi:hypothetical protein